MAGGSRDNRHPCHHLYFPAPYSYSVGFHRPSFPAWGLRIDQIDEWTKNWIN